MEVTDDEWQANADDPEAAGACMMYSAGMELQRKRKSRVRRLL
jgi:hypothetical protein